MFITSFEEQNITYRSCSNLRIHLFDCTNLYAGDLKLNLDTPRKIATWKSTLHELVTLGLIQDEYDGKLFNLTKQGWKAFDQLKEQMQEK
ncbi:hypothetical protein AAU60_05500 [Acinetobacter johnsonii]|nr:hypothetical protein AAU60_05500 [Acinetobacter johnsonii]